MNNFRSHHCAQLRKSDLGAHVVLSGWVKSRRDHGGVIFIDLGDREGITQIVFDPHKFPGVAEKAHALRDEWVIQIKGEVVSRLSGTENKNLVTGEIEISASELVILNKAETPPFQLDAEIENEILFG